MKSSIAWAVACLCLVVVPTLRGQEPGEPNIAGPPNPTERSALVNGNALTEQQLLDTLKEIQSQLQKQDNRLTQLETSRPSAATPMPDSGQTEELRELAARINNLEGNIRALTATVNNLQGTTGQQAMYGNLPILSKMRTDPNFREEMRNVVQGRLVFNNLTGVEQPVLINGNRWRVPAGPSSLMVPFGTVYAQLPWEMTKAWDQWRFVGDQQELTINIAY